MHYEVYCNKKGYSVLCIPEKRKRDSMFPKWWCFNCHRYVLPDGKYHYSMWNSRAITHLHF